MAHLELILDQKRLTVNDVASTFGGGGQVLQQDKISNLTSVEIESKVLNLLKQKWDNMSIKVIKWIRNVSNK